MRASPLICPGTAAARVEGNLGSPAGNLVVGLGRGPWPGVPGGSAMPLVPIRLAAAGPRLRPAEVSSGLSSRLATSGGQPTAYQSSRPPRTDGSVLQRRAQHPRQDEGARYVGELDHLVPICSRGQQQSAGGRGRPILGSAGGFPLPGELPSRGGLRGLLFCFPDPPGNRSRTKTPVSRPSMARSNPNLDRTRATRGSIKEGMRRKRTKAGGRP